MLPDSGQGLPVLVGTSFPLPVPISPRTDSSCRSNSLGQPTCTRRAKCLQGEELVTPSWVPVRLAGLGLPLAVPTGEEAALPGGGDTQAGVHSSLDHKHLHLRRAHCLLLDAQGTLGRGSQAGVSPIQESPLPRGAIPMFPHAVIHTAHPPPPASHSGTPNLTQTPHPSGPPSWQLT